MIDENLEKTPVMGRYSEKKKQIIFEGIQSTYKIDI